MFPNPSAAKELEENDRLLCFGKHENMRSLIPARSKRPKRVRKLPKNPIIEPVVEEAPADKEA